MNVSVGEHRAGQNSSQKAASFHYPRRHKDHLMGFMLDSFTDSNVMETPETPVQLQFSFLTVLSIYRPRETFWAPEVEVPVIFR
jgi:hypothetical protein